MLQSHEPLATYEAHHYCCDDCARAGTSRSRHNRRERCGEGQALWVAYCGHHQAVDRAYLLHHMACATCIGAGVAPGRSQRCPEGAALWRAYNDAGVPPQLWTAPQISESA